MAEMPNQPDSSPAQDASKQLVLDLSSFEPRPEEVAKERAGNAIVFGLISAVIVGGLGYLAGGRMEWQKTGTWVATACGVAVGALAGGAAGRHFKTNEEAHSETLLKAARSGDFASTMKKELQKREDDAVAMEVAATNGVGR